MKFGVNCWVWTAGVTVEKLAPLAAKVKQMGFDLIEIPIEDTAVLDYQAAAHILRDNGLEANICAAIGPDRDLIHPDAAIQENAKGYLSHCIDAASTLGAQFIVGPIYSAVGRTWQQTADERAQDVETLVNNLSTVSKKAADHGVTLGIEPLNRFETSFINTAKQVVEVIDRVDSPSCQIMLDSFHMNIEEKSLYDAIVTVGHRLAYLHACGSDRGAPGNGNVPWHDVEKGLKAIGYDGPVVIESFTSEVKSIARAAAIWRAFEPTQDDIAENGLAFLRDLFAA